MSKRSDFDTEQNYRDNRIKYDNCPNCKANYPEENNKLSFLYCIDNIPIKDQYGEIYHFDRIYYKCEYCNFVCERLEQKK